MSLIFLQLIIIIIFSLQSPQSDPRNGDKPQSGGTTPPNRTSTPSKSTSQDSVSDIETPQHSLERQNSLPPSSPSFFGGRSDLESDAEQGGQNTPKIEGVTKDELIASYKKQERVLSRYKSRFSEVQ